MSCDGKEFLSDGRDAAAAQKRRPKTSPCYTHPDTPRSCPIMPVATATAVATATSPVLAVAIATTVAGVVAVTGFWIPLVADQACP